MSGVRVLRSHRSTSPVIQCRTAALHDYEQIHALERRYNMGSKSYEEWSHMWVNNPVCKRLPHLPIGWVLEDNGNQIVGSLGSVPFGFELDSRQLIAGTSSGWVVDERYRGYAPLLLDRFLSQPDVDLYLCVSPNSQAQPAVALECDRVPVGVWDRAAFWITNYQGFARSVLAKREVRLRTLLRYPLATVLRLLSALGRDGLKSAMRRLEDYDIRTCTDFDDRFDDFWGTVRARTPHRLLASRTREVLEWHFKHPLARRTAWVSTVCQDGRLVAYAILCRNDVTTIGLRCVRLLDYQSLDGDASLLLPILAETLERCRRDGTAMLESIGWRLGSGDLMDRIAPYTRTMRSWHYFYKAANPALASTLEDRAVWSPSLYDGDACI